MQIQITPLHAKTCSAPKPRDKRTIHATWEGGPYIDIGYSPSRPLDVINVWDYEQGQSSIPYTREAARQVIKSWISNYSEGEGCGTCEVIRDLDEMARYY